MNRKAGAHYKRAIIASGNNFPERALCHIDRGLHFGTDMSDIPPSIKLFLVQLPSLVTPASIYMLSGVNRQFRELLEVARQLYHSWQQNEAISDDNVKKALAFSPLLFGYAPERIRQDVHIARDMVQHDPNALQRCVDVVNELDHHYQRAEDKNDFIEARFPEVIAARLLEDVRQDLNEHADYQRWGTPLTYTCRTSGNIFHFYRPGKYEFYKRKEKIRREVNKYYMERKIADLCKFEDPNNQEPTFFDWYANLKKMRVIKSKFRSYYKPNCYEKAYIVQLVLKAIEQDPWPYRHGTTDEYKTSRTRCLKVIITAELEGTWHSERHRQITHYNMQQILQDTVAITPVLVGHPYGFQGLPLEYIEPTQIRLELQMEGEWYGKIDNHDEWFREGFVPPFPNNHAP